MPGSGSKRRRVPRQQDALRRHALLRPEVLRMLLSVKENEALNPAAIGIFSPETKVPKPSYIAHAVEQFSFGHDDA